MPKGWGARRTRGNAVRLLLDCGGSAWAEYALLIATLVASLAACVDVLGHFTQQSLGRALVSNRERGAAAASASNGLSRAAPRPAATTASTAASPTVESPTFQFPWWFPLEIGALVLAGVSWCVLHRRFRRQRAEDAEEDECLLPGSEPDESDRLFEKRQHILAALSREGALSGGKVLVRHVMSPATFCVSPAATADDVRRLMEEHRLRHVLVCRGETLLGVISDRDLARKQGAKAADLMAPRPCTVAPDTPLNPAVTLMIGRGISCLPVVDGGVLRGLFTTTDLVLALQCAFQIIEREAALRQTLDEAVGSPASI
jgi:CBS domain-containing protein